MVVATQSAMQRYVEKEMGNGLPSYVNSGDLEKTLGENSVYALEKKYLVRDDRGHLIETPAQAIYRMSSFMANVEKQYGKSDQEVEQFTKQFYDIISKGWFSPAGRIWTNAGTEIKGLFNCYVLPVEDKLNEIFDSVRKAAIIHKNGGGTGYNYSKLRPRGTYVKKSKGVASGVVSFISQFDKETEVINSGNRRGANMGIVDVNHPDILDFIYAKAVKKEITNFNVSLGVYDYFMEAVEREEFYDLQFPKGKPFMCDELEDIIRNIEENKIGGSDVGKLPKPSSMKFDSKEVFPGKTKIIDSVSGKVAGRVDERSVVQLYAPYVFNLASELAWETADPGMIFLDQINKFNPLPLLGQIIATNPCGEQPLHPYDACNLGSIILSKMIKSNGKNEVDWERLEYTTKLATRFMDNVNDANKGPIPEIEETVLRHRRIGLGVMGWADMLSRLDLSYDSDEAYQLAKEVMGFITKKSKEASVEIAKEKGVFPAFEGSIYDNGKLEDRVRNVDRTTIAPTGTIAMVYDVGSGIEPFFAVTYVKNIRGGDSLDYFIAPFVEACEKRGIDLNKVLPLIKKNNGSIHGLKEIPEDLQKIFKTAHDLPYEVHIKMQAAFQEVTDNAISKTINMKKEASVEHVRNAYFMAWKYNLKGVTVYRDGSKDVQVLETGKAKSDLEKITAEIPLKVPEIMPSIKVRQSTHYGNIHLEAVMDPKRDYSIVETFAQLGNAGGEESATMEALGRLSSTIVRIGGDIDMVIAQLKDISSGAGVSTRDGGIHSLPQGFARGLMKVEALKKLFNVEDFMLGKLNYNEVSEIVADYLRTGNLSEKYEANRLPEEISEGDNNGSRKSLYKPKCPDCGNELIFQEGCKKCTTCGFSKC